MVSEESGITFEELRDDIIEASGRENNPPYRLSEMSFNELYDIVKKQMSSGTHPSSIRFGLAMPFQPIEDSGMVGVGTQPAPDVDSYDTDNLMNAFAGSFGRLLATSTSTDYILGLKEKLSELYDTAIECENNVESVNKPERDKQDSILKIFYTTSKYSRYIECCQLILEGLVETSEISIDEETKKIYDISTAEEISRLPEFVEGIDRYLKGIGQMIMANADDSKAWLLDIFDSITFRLEDQNIDNWSKKCDVDSKEFESLRANRLKIWACYNIIKGYMKEKYGIVTGQEKPPIITERQKEVIARYKMSCDVMERLEIYPGSESNIIDIYLLKIGVNKLL